MTHITLDADYLVIGAGAMSMAFVDTMLTESDSRFVIVDRRHMPGGHWNDAYSFVRLHQPSSFYGVNSRALGSDRIDETGSNAGFYELASGAEVTAYFEQVMRETFLPSGRVQYFPMCEFVGDAQFKSLLSGDEYTVNVRNKTVDGTYYQTSVPATHKRPFAVSDDASCITPNDLPRRAHEFQNFVILGGGKTAMDTCLWLLEHGAPEDSLTWVVPRDSWLTNRATTQPGAAFFQGSIGGFALQLEAMRDATSVEDLFLRLERAEQLFRIDTNTMPTMFHFATISEGEVEQLRRIKNVVRGRRVSEVSAANMVMSDGAEISVPPGALYIDCTASAVPFREPKPTPIFQDDLITLRAVRAPLVSFSAALIGFVEASFDNVSEKNKLCTAIDLSDTPKQWTGVFAKNMINQNVWGQEPKVRDWLRSARLDPFGSTISQFAGASPENGEIMRRIGETAIPAVMNLMKIAEE